MTKLSNVVENVLVGPDVCSYNKNCTINFTQETDERTKEGL